MTLADIYERQLEEEALRRELDDTLACPNCARDVADDYVACPHCTTALKHPCDECKRAVSFAWIACPWCATPTDQRPTDVDQALGTQDQTADEFTSSVKRSEPTSETRPDPTPKPAQQAKTSSPFRRGHTSDRGNPSRIVAAD